MKTIDSSETGPHMEIYMTGDIADDWKNKQYSVDGGEKVDY